MATAEATVSTPTVPTVTAEKLEQAPTLGSGARDSFDPRVEMAVSTTQAPKADIFATQARQAFEERAQNHIKELLNTRAAFELAVRKPETFRNTALAAGFSEAQTEQMTMMATEWKVLLEGQVKEEHRKGIKSFRTEIAKEAERKGLSDLYEIERAKLVLADLKGPLPMRGNAASGGGIPEWRSKAEVTLAEARRAGDLATSESAIAAVTEEAKKQLATGSANLDKIAVEKFATAVGCNSSAIAESIKDLPLERQKLIALTTVFGGELAQEALCAAKDLPPIEGDLTDPAVRQKVASDIENHIKTTGLKLPSELLISAAVIDQGKTVEGAPSPLVFGLDTALRQRQSMALALAEAKKAAEVTTPVASAAVGAPPAPVTAAPLTKTIPVKQQFYGSAAPAETHAKASKNATVSPSAAATLTEKMRKDFFLDSHPEFGREVHVRAQSAVTEQSRRVKPEVSLDNAVKDIKDPTERAAMRAKVGEAVTVLKTGVVPERLKADAEVVKGLKAIKSDGLQVKIAEAICKEKGLDVKDTLWSAKRFNVAQQEQDRKKFYGTDVEMIATLLKNGLIPPGYEATVARVTQEYNTPKKGGFDIGPIGGRFEREGDRKVAGPVVNLNPARWHIGKTKSPDKENTVIDQNADLSTMAERKIAVERLYGGATARDAIKIFDFDEKIAKVRTQKERDKVTHEKEKFFATLPKHHKDDVTNALVVLNTGNLPAEDKNEIGGIKAEAERLKQNIGVRAAAGPVEVTPLTVERRTASVGPRIGVSGWRQGSLLRAGSDVSKN